MSESADSIGKVICDLESLVGQHVTTIEEGIIRTCDRLSALERQSAERIAELSEKYISVVNKFDAAGGDDEPIAWATTTPYGRGYRFSPELVEFLDKDTPQPTAAQEPVARDGHVAYHITEPGVRPCISAVIWNDDSARPGKGQHVYLTPAQEQGALEKAEAALAEAEKLFRAIRPALACEDMYNPCSDLRRRIDAFIQQHNNGGGGNGNR